MIDKETKFLITLFLVVVGILFIGFILGYAHVIVHSEAYCVDYGDTLALIVDGHTYHYAVSPGFYK